MHETRSGSAQVLRFGRSKSPSFRGTTRRGSPVGGHGPLLPWIHTEEQKLNSKATAVLNIATPYFRVGEFGMGRAVVGDAIELNPDAAYAAACQALTQNPTLDLDQVEKLIKHDRAGEMPVTVALMELLRGRLQGAGPNSVYMGVADLYHLPADERRYDSRNHVVSAAAHIHVIRCNLCHAVPIVVVRDHECSRHQEELALRAAFADLVRPRLTVVR